MNSISPGAVRTQDPGSAADWRPVQQRPRLRGVPHGRQDRGRRRSAGRGPGVLGVPDLLPDHRHGDPADFRFIADKLNNHGGRVDNFGFFTHPDIAQMPDMALLDGLLNEDPGALTGMRAAGTLA